jgi:hypothetical protein
LGFSDKANLDEGAMWPTAFALTELTVADEARGQAVPPKASAGPVSSSVLSSPLSSRARRSLAR